MKMFFSAPAARSPQGGRRATTLLELLFTFFFLALFLVVLSGLLRGFMRARFQGIEQDQRLRAVQQVQSTLCSELELAVAVTRVGSDVVLTRLNPNPTLPHLPDIFPTPAPARDPAWNPDGENLSVRYYLDSPSGQLRRQATFTGGPASQQVIIPENVGDFQVTQAQPRLYEVKVVLKGRNNLETLQFKAYRWGR